VGVLLTKSLTGLLGLLLTLAVYMTNYLRSKLVNAFIFFLAVSAIILSMGVNFTFNNNGAPTLAKAGSEFVRRLQQLPIEKIFIGVGSRSLEEVKSGPLLEEKEKDPLADYLLENGHLRLVLENGILGWGIIMWILLGALQTIHKAQKAESDPYMKSLLRAAFSAILGFLISMNGFNAFSSITLQFFFWSLVGVAVAVAVHHGKNGGFYIVWRFGRE
jgi:hypothetical protein